MKTFFTIFQTEWLKLMKKFSTIALVVVALALCVLFSFVNHVTSSSKSNWRQEMEQELSQTKTQYERAQEDYKDDPETLELLNSIYEEQIATYEYALDHNIPYNTFTVWNDVDNSTILLNLVSLLLLCFAITTFASEYHLGTMKQILASPYRRISVLASKYFSYAIFAILFMALQFVVAFLSGLIIDGFGAPIDLAYQNGSVVEVNLLGSIFCTYVFRFIQFLVLLVFALGISVFTRSSIAGILGSLLIWLGNSILGNFCSGKTWYTYTFFPHIGPGNYIENGHFLGLNEDVTRSIVILGSYVLVFAIVSTIYFKKKDI